MDERGWRVAAAATAGALVVWMALLQGPLTPSVRAPWPLFWTFLSAWVAAVVVLLAAPRVGVVATAVGGIVSASGAWRTHAEGGWEDLLLVGLSLAASAFAATAWLLARRYGRRPLSS